MINRRGEELDRGRGYGRIRLRLQAVLIGRPVDFRAIQSFDRRHLMQMRLNRVQQGEGGRAGLSAVGVVADWAAGNDGRGGA